MELDDTPLHPVFIAGIRHIDRVRGKGWLDCPNCHEHAAQDVVDDMGFLALLFYRFSPVGQRRDLVCRRCGYRRPASLEEMQKLQTGGERIARAWLVPMGGFGIGVAVAVVGLLVAVSNSQSTSVDDSVTTYSNRSCDQLGPCKFLGPDSFQYNLDVDSIPHALTGSNRTGDLKFVIRRIIDSATLPELLKNHFRDEAGLVAEGFPLVLPETTPVSIGGVTAQSLKVDYQSSGQGAEQRIYGLLHDGVGYTITFVSLSDKSTKMLDQLVAKVNGNFTFTTTETPPPLPSPSPTPTPVPKATPAKPAAKPTPTPHR